MGRSCGVGNGNLLQYPCLGNPMDRRAWWATVHGVAKSQVHARTRMRAHTHTRMRAHTHTHTHARARAHTHAHNDANTLPALIFFQGTFLYLKLSVCDLGVPCFRS